MWEPLLRGLSEHEDGEYFPIDAFNELAAVGKVAGVTVTGRLDTGTPLGLLQASVEVALRRDDVAETLRAWLVKRLGKDDG